MDYPNVINKVDYLIHLSEDIAVSYSKFDTMVRGFRDLLLYFYKEYMELRDTSHDECSRLYAELAMITWEDSLPHYSPRLYTIDSQDWTVDEINSAMVEEIFESEAYWEYTSNLSTKNQSEDEH